MRARNNSATAGFAPKADLDTPEYAERVARPSMAAIDAMPQAYRELVNEYGYIDVYRAWKRGYSPQTIRERTQDGVFSL